MSNRALGRYDRIADSTHPGLGSEVLTAAYVRSILHYNPETGVFTWRKRKAEMFNNKGHGGAEGSCASWNARFAGAIAGSTNHHKCYIYITINFIEYSAHRLAWLCVTGEWPKEQIDHIDCNRSNNRFDNLREATHAENSRNTRKRRDNTSGHKGVSFDRQYGKWSVSISVNGRQIRKGRFVEKKDAIEAYEKAAKEYHLGFARTS